MKSLAILSLVLLFISACSIRPEAKPPITQYFLQPEISLTCLPSPSQKVIRLNFASTGSFLSTQNITYTKSDLIAGTYLYSKWSQRVDHSISTALYTALKDNKVFSRLVYENTLIQSDLILELKVLRFEHHFTDTEHSKAVIILDATIYDSKTHELLSNHLFKADVKAETNDAKGAVNALNTALESLLTELICWSVQQKSLS